MKKNGDEDFFATMQPCRYAGSCPAVQIMRVADTVSTQFGFGCDVPSVLEPERFGRECDVPSVLEHEQFDCDVTFRS